MRDAPTPAGGAPRSGEPVMRQSRSAHPNRPHRQKPNEMGCRAQVKASLGHSMGGSIPSYSRAALARANTRPTGVSVK